MELPLKITFRHMEASPAVEAAIRQRAGKLEQFSEHIIACHVVVEAPHHHQRKGELFKIRIDLTVPGEEIPVTHNGRKDHAHEDIYVAIHDAFDAAARVLEEHIRKFRGDTKAHEVPLHGKVLRLFPYEGYGFIETSDHREIYFHRNSVTNNGFDRLVSGAEVRLVVAEDESIHGPQASTVIILGKHHIVE